MTTTVGGSGPNGTNPRIMPEVNRARIPKSYCLGGQEPGTLGATGSVRRPLGRNAVVMPLRKHMVRISEIARVGLSAAALAVCPGTTGHGLEQTAAPAVRYLGQAPPGTTPARFAPGIVSTSAIEINAAFRPDFREFFFARDRKSVV